MEGRARSRWSCGEFDIRTEVDGLVRCIVIDCGECFRMDAAGDGVSTESKGSLTLTVYIFSYECDISCLPLYPLTYVPPI